MVKLLYWPKFTLKLLMTMKILTHLYNVEDNIAVRRMTQSQNQIQILNQILTLNLIPILNQILILNLILTQSHLKIGLKKEKIVQSRTKELVDLAGLSQSWQH